MRRTVRSLLFLLALIPVAPLAAQAGLLVPTSTGQADDRVLAIREMTLDVGIARGYARVNVRQIFENRTSVQQEGTYRFALPPSASVGDFAIWDGLERIPGVILEKRRARAIYQELTRQRVDPGLLQQGEEDSGADGGTSRPSAASLFSVTVSPIPAYATKRLELQFQEETPFIGGVGEFRLVLRPPDAEAPVVKKLTIHVRIEDGSFEAVAAGLPLAAETGGAAFTGTDVKLDRDLTFRIRPAAGEALKLSAFRDPDGRLPDGLALAPWERPSDVPPEKDGFFLLQALPPGATAKAGLAAKGDPKPDAARPGQTVVILFDTSLSHRWGGLETAYGELVRVLQALRGDDRFALIPYDRLPAEGVALAAPTPQAIESALSALRARPLGPGADAAKAIAAARKLAGVKGRILLLTSGVGIASSKALKAALDGVPLFSAVSNGEAGESLRAASAQTISPTSTEIEGDLFFQRLLAPEVASASSAKEAGAPFTFTGGDAKVRDIYPVLVQPMAAGSLSGWVGRYGVPQPKVHVELTSALFPGGKQALDGALPEKALDARDLPRRWARARVDDLLARIERDGERREWVDEVIALSKRYKFVTPYTAFLAAPRSLLRPRRIQPGDPVLRVECDGATVAATALLPFGVKLDLVRRPKSNLWEGRFLVPEGLKDGRYPVRILIQDASGARISETKHFILDGEAPVIHPDLPATARPGDLVRIAATADQDVVLLSARVGDAPPIPLRWDPTSQRSVGLVRIPYGMSGTQEVTFEAVDAAKNRGFARAGLEVRP